MGGRGGPSRQEQQSTEKTTGLELRPVESTDRILRLSHRHGIAATGDAPYRLCTEPETKNSRELVGPVSGGELRSQDQPPGLIVRGR